jgi:uncharacterized protein (DUF983 family)
MAKRRTVERQLDPEQLTEDVYGNNAAATCPSCGKVYVVSEFLDKKGRKCPKCGRSAVIVRGKDGQKIGTISSSE